MKKISRLATLQNQKTLRLHRAGRRLLAQSDFDAISVATIAKNAGCSVGAFYERFRDKHSFLRFLISNQMRSEEEAVEARLATSAAKAKSRAQAIEGIVDALVVSFSAAETAGAMRAALKLGATDENALEPVSYFRQAVTDMASQALGPFVSGRGSKRRIDEAMQVLFGVLFDTIQQDHGPMTLQSKRLKMVLTSTAEAILGDTAAGGTIKKAKIARPSEKNRIKALAKAHGHDIEFEDDATPDPPPEKLRRKGRKLI